VVFALGEQPEFSLSYLYQGSQPVPANGWFGLNGGRADVSIPVARRWSVAGEVAGLHTGSYGTIGSPLTLLTFMAGPRFRFLGRDGEKDRRFTPFAQFLLGGAHATTGLFPTSSGLNTTASSVALSVGGGVQARLSPRVSLRLLQFDYLYTHLPNGTNSFQNNYRIGAGLAFRIR